MYSVLPQFWHTSLELHFGHSVCSRHSFCGVRFLWCLFSFLRTTFPFPVSSFATVKVVASAFGFFSGSLILVVPLAWLFLFIAGHLTDFVVTCLLLAGRVVGNGAVSGRVF